MEAKEIIVSVVKSNKSDNNVWAVAITGFEEPAAHCKSPYKAMRFMFLLKQRTGFAISADSLSFLSQEIARQKAVQAAEAGEPVAGAPQEPATPQPTEAAPSESPKPKRSRKHKVSTM